MFTGASSDDEGCRIWADQGKVVVLKDGENGSRIFAGDHVIDVPSYSVEEVDPTGAGDTFCGAFLTALTEGKRLEECGRFANAAGAMSVRKQGPMEGAPSRAELEAFLAAHA
jgi:sugar/nucleoside kinase (ribokinase family)